MEKKLELNIAALEKATKMVEISNNEEDHSKTSNLLSTDSTQEGTEFLGTKISRAGESSVENSNKELSYHQTAHLKILMKTYRLQRGLIQDKK